MKLFRVLTIVFLFCLINSVTAIASNGPQKSWDEKCRVFKKHYMSNKLMAIKFSKKPTLNTRGQYWVLKWNNIDIPVPAVKYSGVFVTSNKGGKPGLLFVTANKSILVHAFTFKNKKISDVFETSSVGTTDKTSTKNGRAATVKMFGGPVRYSDLVRMAYKYTPATLSCDLKNRDKESGQMFVMVLKNVKSVNQLIKVHSGVGASAGWIEQLQNKVNTIVHLRVNMLLKTSPDILHQVFYQYPENSHFRSLPYLIGDAKLVKKLESPVWMLSLNRALKLNNNKAWAQYLRDARDAKFSSKSMQSIIKNFSLKIKP